MKKILVLFPLIMLLLSSCSSKELSQCYTKICDRPISDENKMIVWMNNNNKEIDYISIEMR